MRGQGRTGLACAIAALAWASPLLPLVGCGDDDSGAGKGARAAAKSSAAERAARRAYDGAPPVIPHQSFGVACISCHNEKGVEVAGVGFAPPSPHEGTPGMSAASRCQQCHVFRGGEGEFAANAFSGLPQNFRKGERLYRGAPPSIPHRLFMRENCLACHGGGAAREEIRCSHPERSRCLQCHAASSDAPVFSR